jgi:5-methylcytosine-specific restriction endonuclease McrA
MARATITRDAGGPITRNASGPISRVHYTVRQKTEREKSSEYRQLNYRRLWTKQAGLCFICKKPLHSIRRYNHLDHWRPIAAGGKTEDTNIVLVHMKCNLSKGARWHAA